VLVWSRTPHIWRDEPNGSDVLVDTFNLKDASKYSANKDENWKSLARDYELLGPMPAALCVHPTK